MTRRLVFLWIACIGSVLAQAPEPNGGGVRPGSLPAHWMTGGPDCVEVPDWQVHAYNEDFYILRQSGCVNYEKPFLYLLFGKDKALLEDTGAEPSDAARAVTDVVAKWLKAKGRTSIELIVTHSHSHGDHVAGDAGFRGLPHVTSLQVTSLQVTSLQVTSLQVTMVPLTVEGTSAFFQIEKWPEGIGHVDLGGRVLDVIPIPGHDKLSLAFYDRETGVLLTGDSLYPGRLYVRDFPAFVRSTDRLVEFTKGKIVAQVLGTHIEEMATPYKDYPVGTKYQPEEHGLALSRGTLLELQDAVRGMGDTAVRVALRDFTVWPVK